MNTKAAQLLRNGGMSRRGFLRSLGVTACAALVPGLMSGFTQPILESGTWCVTINSIRYQLAKMPVTELVERMDLSPVAMITVRGTSDGRDGVYRIINHEVVEYMPHD